MTNNQESLIAKKGPIWTFNPFATPYKMQSSTSMVSETHKTQRKADETPTKSDNSNMSLPPTPNDASAPLSPSENSLPSSFSGQNPPILNASAPLSPSENFLPSSFTEQNSPPVTNKDQWKKDERSFRKNLATSKKFEEKEVEGCNTPADLLYKLANSTPDLKVNTINKFFEEFDIKRIIWGLGALNSKHKSSEIFLDFIGLCKEELDFLLNDDNVSTVGPLKCFIIEALYQTFHFEVPDIGGIINKIEFVSLFKCNCGHRITFVHTNYMDGKCTNTECNITYEEKHSFNFNITNPILKGGSLNSETPNPHVFALLPSKDKSCYEPYVFTPDEFNITPVQKDSEIKLNSDGVSKINDENHKRDELIGIISNLKNKSKVYKDAFNKVLDNLKIIVMNTWKYMHNLITNVEDKSIFENYWAQAINKWNNKVKYKTHSRAKPLYVPLNYDGFLQALEHKLNMGKTVYTSTSSPPPTTSSSTTSSTSSPPPTTSSSTTSSSTSKSLKRSFSQVNQDEETEDLENDEKKEYKQVTNTKRPKLNQEKPPETIRKRPNFKKFKKDRKKEKE